MQRTHLLAGLLAGLGAGALWGIVFVAPLWLPGRDALAISLGRYLVYAFLCGLLLVVQRAPRLPPPLLVRAVCLGFLGNSLYYTLIVLAVRYANAAVASLMVGTVPIWLALVEVFRPGMQAGFASLRRIALPLLAIALGLALINLDGVMDVWTWAPVRFFTGFGLAVAGTASWTLFAIWNARTFITHPTLSPALWTNWLGVGTGLSLLLFVPLANAETWQTLRHPDTPIMLTWLLLGVGATWLASLLWNTASKRLPIGMAGQLILSETLFALFYASILHDALPGQLALIAIVLFTLGVVSCLRVLMRLQTAKQNAD